MVDSRLLAIITRLSEDLANIEKAMEHTRVLLHELSKDLSKDLSKNDKAEPPPASAGSRFLAQQQPRQDGTFPNSAWVRLPPHENEEEQ